MSTGHQTLQVPSRGHYEQEGFRHILWSNIQIPLRCKLVWYAHEVFV